MIPVDRDAFGQEAGGQNIKRHCASSHAALPLARDVERRAPGTGGPMTGRRQFALGAIHETGHGHVHRRNLDQPPGVVQEELFLDRSQLSLA